MPETCPLALCPRCGFHLGDHIRVVPGPGTPPGGASLYACATVSREGEPVGWLYPPETERLMPAFRGVDR